MTSEKEEVKFAVKNQSEIRINQEYTSILFSDYESKLEGKSIPKKRKQVIPSATYFDRMIDSIQGKQKSSMILPMYCRYIESTPQRSIYILEEPPAFRTIYLDFNMGSDIEELKSEGKLEEYGYKNLEKESPISPFSVTLAMPFSIFILIVNPSQNRVTDGMFFFRTQPLTGFGDHLFKAPLSNINSNQFVCFGDDFGKRYRSISEAIEQTRTGWWSTQFNRDYIYNLESYENVAGVSNFLTWQYMSKKDPMFIYNVDWIKHPQSVDQVIRSILNSRRMDTKETLFGYSKMFQLFDHPTKTGKTIEIEKGYFKELYYGVSNGIMIGSHPLNVGDPLILKGEEVVYVSSFAGYSSSSSSHILLTSDKREFLFKLTRKSRSFLKQKIIEQRYIPEVITPKGIVLKADQIIGIKNIYGKKRYKKVQYIRPAMDGKQEIRIGSEFYLVENLTDDIEILDVAKPKYHGTNLIKDDDYWLSQRASGMIALQYVTNTIFDGIQPGSNGKLTLSFRDTSEENSGHVYTFPFEDGTIIPGQRVFDADKVEELPKIFALGRKLLLTKNRETNNITHSYKIGFSVLINQNDMIFNPNIDDVVSECLIDDNFVVRTNALDISFKIGDKIVAADIKNPINCLTVKTITAFKVDRENNQITFVLIDNQDNLSEVIYVKDFGGSCAIYIGRIRKITNIFNDVCSGSKIVAKEAGMSVFPKKDSNIIIGFLTDTGGEEPLVLCSNGCTLWFNDMIDNFKIIPMDSPTWGDLKHVPLDITKIKIQPGDVVIGSSIYNNHYGFLVCRNPTNKGLKGLWMEFYSDGDRFTIDSHFAKDVVFDCIPNPRLSIKESDQFGVATAVPNFHGLYMASEDMVYNCYMINDQRRIVNV